MTFDFFTCSCIQWKAYQPLTYGSVEPYGLLGDPAAPILIEYLCKATFTCIETKIVPS